MTPLADILLVLLLALWVVMALVSVILNRRHGRRYRDRPPRGRGEFQPHAVVIMPIKGIDRDLPGCVRGLCTQDYSDYEVIIVVESESDPAYAVVIRELALYPQRVSRVMVAGVAPASEGQKVHNQRFVLGRILPELADDAVLAFADSDAIPGPDWLAYMAGKLVGGKVGVSTGYRWMVPDDQGRASVWSKLASIINGSVASSYRPGALDQAWGGAMAMTVGVARAGNLVSELEGALTDDYPITQMSRRLGLPVRYVHRCLVATPVDFTLTSLWTFARRQYVITRIYSPYIYAYALTSLTLWLAGFVVAWGWLIAWIARGGGDHGWILPAAAIVTVFILHQVRSNYRRQLIHAALGEKAVESLRSTLLLDRWLTPVWMGLHWLIAISALSSNRFSWRGIRYQLDGPRRVRRL